MSDSTGTLASAMGAALDDIRDFYATEPFQKMLREFWALPPEERPGFVTNVILDDAERRRRGIEVEEGLVIQRSEFSDGRPTLFCITKKLPKGVGWHKVTITFDNPREGEADATPAAA